MAACPGKRQSAFTGTNRIIATSLPSLNGFQRAVEFGDEVIDVLEADGEAHEFRQDAALAQVVVGELRVRRRGGVDHERLGVADVRQEREDLAIQGVREGAGLLDAGVREDRVELREGASVEVVGGDDLVAGLRDVRDGEEDRRRAGGKRLGRCAALKGRAVMVSTSRRPPLGMAATLMQV